MKRLWQADPTLRIMASGPVVGKSYSADSPPARDEGLRWIAKKYTVGGYEFIPLVGVAWPSEDDRPQADVLCSLDILFLRREPAGSVVQGGDIDNRIKNLFDGLTLPQNSDDVTEEPTEDENPMYCLLRDDGLIGKLTVNTDLLLRPPLGFSKHEPNDVVLVIEVEVKGTGKAWPF